MKKKVPFQIRPIQKADKPALALIYQSCFSTKAYSEKWPLTSAQKRVSQILAQPQVSGWVVTAYRQPVGFAFIQIREGFNGSYGELLETAIHPYFQNQDLEKPLFKMIRQFQRSKKLKTLFTVTYQGAPEKFFKGAGFVRSKRSVIYVSK